MWQRGPYLDIMKTGDICLNDMDIASISQLGFDLFVSGGLVADHADDDVVGVCGQVAEQGKLARC